jgi:hypothetical protein
MIGDSARPSIRKGGKPGKKGEFPQIRLTGVGEECFISAIGG